MAKSNEYKEWVTGVFDRSSDSYDHVGPRFFTYFGRGLVEFSEIRAGARLLDIACGRGAVLIPASEKIGKSGEVIGIDISSGMVTRLENDLKHLEISNATVIRMDAEDLQFQSLSFDYVLCGLALFFFPDLNVALNEFFRVLKPGAHLVVSTLEGAETPWRDSLLEVRKSYRERLASAPIMDTKDLDREEEVVEELEAVGFVEIEHMIDSYQFSFRDETEWWEAQWSIFHRAFMERLDSDSLKEYKREVTNIVRECKNDKGIQINYSVRYSRAKKPVISK
ncbi:MAG: methyltransferase domain-containing protein [Desulfobacterales bacterium]|nr:methyltransferase domain-containing protein [Desulfobacterales bacterium]